ncbi:hypothetical protein BaRGS_00016778 [Batillaria attramentaria]|uniref:Uncharacterized protein n=1 Tax=Batillaria attramentaria TaxID=370345 RepID=A0ABD0KXT1_9CAEN
MVCGESGLVSQENTCTLQTKPIFNGRHPYMAGWSEDDLFSTRLNTCQQVTTTTSRICRSIQVVSGAYITMETAGQFARIPRWAAVQPGSHLAKKKWMLENFHQDTPVRAGIIFDLIYCCFRKNFCVHIYLLRSRAVINEEDHKRIMTSNDACVGQRSDE